MSREAMEAVQDHSTISDPTGIAVFVAIARFVGPDGQPGWASYRTLAEVAHCDKDTVGRWVGILEETGELSVRKEGRGRGTRMYYTINLPFDEPKHGGAGRGDNQAKMSPPERDDNSGDNVAVLSQQIELLSQQIELLSQRLESLSPTMSQNVPTRKGQKPETSEKPKKPKRETNTYLPKKAVVYAGNGEKQRQFEQMADAILEVCVLHNGPGNRNKAESLAVSLVESGFTSDWLRDDWLPWFRANDWRGKKGEQPAIHIIEATAEKARQFPNGTSQQNSNSKKEFWES